MNVGSVVEVFGEMRDAKGDDVVDYLRVKQQLLVVLRDESGFLRAIEAEREELWGPSCHKCPCGTQVCY